MKKSLTAVAVSLLVVSAAHASDDRVVRKEIAARYAAQASAMQQKDANAYVSILTEDYQQIPAFGMALGVADVKASATSKMTKGGDETAPAIVSLNVTGDRAVVVSKRTFTFPYRNAKFETETRTHTSFYDELWVRTSTGWKMKIRRDAGDASTPPPGFGK